MRQDNTSTLSGLASFAKLQGLLTARRHEGCAEAKMTSSAFVSVPPCGAGCLAPTRSPQRDSSCIRTVAVSMARTAIGSS
jgi:hypothetical protein